MIYKQKLITLMTVFSLMSVGWGCIDGVEVELWGECYNIEETTVLNFSGQGLTGEIPSEIGDLTNLTYLNLRFNELSGEIPPEIGNLLYLNELILHENNLTGEIPFEIGNLINLTQLSLHNNQLTGEIPSSICDLYLYWDSPNSFNLYNNYICPPYPECIDFIGYQNTSNCEEYNPICEDGYMEIEGICLYQSDVDVLFDFIETNGSLQDQVPIYIGSQGWEDGRLTYLKLQFHNLVTIPESIGELSNLKFLMLSSNQLSYIPESIGDLSSLLTLSFGNNELTTLPEVIGNLSSLQKLHLYNNSLTTVPQSICNLTNLLWSYLDMGSSYSYLSDNQLCPPYPDCLVNQEPYIDENENGVWDISEPFEDTNGNGTYEENYVGEQETSNCEEECPDSIEGDLNYDGTVNILDVVTLVTCILSDNRCDICFDINYDGEINVVDIISLVNIILDI